MSPIEPLPPVSLGPLTGEKREAPSAAGEAEVEKRPRVSTEYVDTLATEYKRARRVFLAEVADEEMAMAGVGTPETDVPIFFSTSSVEELLEPGGPTTWEEQSVFLAKKQAKAEVRLRERSEVQRELFTGADGSDRKGWLSLLREKGAVRVLSADEAAEIRRKYPHRIMGRVK